MRHILIVLIASTLFSCTKIIEKALGVKTGDASDIEIPFIEAKDFYNHLVSKNIVLDSFHFLSKGLDSLMKIPFKPGFRESPALQFKCFDSEGKLLMKYGICEGLHRYHNTWSEFPPRSLNRLYQSNETLQEELSFFRSENLQRIEIKRNYDYYFTIYYATFLGKIGKRQLKLLNDYTKLYKEKYKIKTYYLNIDIIKNSSNNNSSAP